MQGKISRRPTRSKSGLSRKCGCWGERRCKDGPRPRSKRPRKKFVNNLRCIAKVKKTPLAYEIWRNRGFRAAISERDEARSPIHAQRKSCPSGVFTAAAARHRRLCRRSALAHRADEESRQNPARPSRSDPQLFQSQKAILQRRHRRLEQQGQTDNAKSLWIPNLPRYRTRFVSRTGKTTGAKRCPQILLTNQFFRKLFL